MPSPEDVTRTHTGAYSGALSVTRLFLFLRKFVAFETCFTLEEQTPASDGQWVVGFPPAVISCFFTEPRARRRAPSWFGDAARDDV